MEKHIKSRIGSEKFYRQFFIIWILATNPPEMISENIFMSNSEAINCFDYIG